MTASIRKFALTAHVLSSVGWFGSVTAFLSLAIAGVMSENVAIVRGAYLSMDLMTWLVIVPFSVAALLTGIVQSVGTTWGLFRHHWIITKLALTVLATSILLVHTQPIGQAATVAAERLLSRSDLRGLRIQLIADAGAALMALIVATTLSVYKPAGLTAYGRRVAGVDASTTDESAGAFWTWLWLAGLLGVVTLFAMMHLSGGMQHH